MSLPKVTPSRDPVAAFFADVALRSGDPLIRRASGSLRIDVVEDKKVEHWYLTIANGDVEVTHKAASADTVIRTSRTLFAALATGEANATAALLRGSLLVEGDFLLMNSLDRLFPGPQASVATFRKREEALRNGSSPQRLAR